MSINWKTLIKNIIIPLAVGGVAGFLTNESMSKYGELNLPPLSPPSVLFPVVWLILFTLMGISAYLVETGKAQGSPGIPSVYWIQLAANFLWPIVFFNLAFYGIAFFWLILLIILVIIMICTFAQISRTSAWLQIPYLLWLLFAAYLNCGVWLLN